MMKKLLIFTFSLLLLFVFTGCSQKVYNIGVVGALSGSISPHTEDSYNTIKYYAENSEVGNFNVIAIDILTYDTPESLLNHINTLNLDFIFGPFLSSEVMTYYDVLSTLDIPVFISTASTDEIYNVDDNFFRLINTTRQQAESLANYMIGRDADSVDIYYDLSNEAYSYEYAQYMVDVFESNEVSYEVLPLGNIHDDEFSVSISNEDAIAIIANANNTGVLSQIIRSQIPEIDIYWSAWAQSQDTITNAGDAADGCFSLSNTYTTNVTLVREITSYVCDEEMDYLNTAVYHNYEIFKFFEYVLEHVDEPNLENMKAFIYELESYEGGLTNYSMGYYGEGKRNYWIMEVVNDSFSEVEEVE